MGTFHPSTELIPVCGITLGNFSKRVYNRAVDCRSLASKEVSMFDSLADRIKQDEEKSTPKMERYLRWGAVAVLSVLVFGGLYLGVSFLNG